MTGYAPRALSVTWREDRGRLKISKALFSPVVTIERREPHFGSSLRDPLFYPHLTPGHKWPGYFQSFPAGLLRQLPGKKISRERQSVFSRWRVAPDYRRLEPASRGGQSAGRS